jgi:hypothetical protein
MKDQRARIRGSFLGGDTPLEDGIRAPKEGRLAVKFLALNCRVIRRSFYDEPLVGALRGADGNSHTLWTDRSGPWFLRFPGALRSGGGETCDGNPPFQ